MHSATFSPEFFNAASAEALVFSKDIVLKKVFTKKTVKPITDFDAKHHKGGGFRVNAYSAATRFSIEYPWQVLITY